MSGRVVAQMCGGPDAGDTVRGACSSRLRHAVAAVPTGEYIGLEGACSQQTTFDLQFSALNERLLHRGYKNWHLKKAYQKSKGRTRDSLLSDNKCNAQETCGQTKDIPTFSTAYSVDFTKIKSIFQKYIPMLNRDSTLKEILSEGCRCVAKRGDL